MSTCQCNRGCGAPKLLPFDFCGKSCAAGTCTHPPFNPIAALAQVVNNTKCACNGCTNLATPPFTFCSKKCGYKTCGHNPGVTPPKVCACPGCSNVAHCSHDFCSKSCGNGSCGHVTPQTQPTLSHTPAAPSPPPAAPSPPPAAPAPPKCACSGCHTPSNPPHQFCSQACGVGSCGHNVASSSSSSSAAPAAPKCACNGCSMPSKPPHPFCSKQCGTGSCPHSGPKCLCVECTKKAFPPHEFCSKICGSRACGHHLPGPMCRCKGCNTPTPPKASDPSAHLEFCSAICEEKSCGHPHKPGLINALSVSDPTKFAELKKQFLDKWLHSSYTPPSTIEIYSVDMSCSKRAFEAYRQSIVAKRPHLAKPKGIAGPGNSRRRFHGTNLECDIGMSTMDTCSKADCSVCLILKSGGLTIKKFGAQTGWGRFGNGIYTTSTSSKANDYSRGAHKAVFMLEVIVGDAVKLTANDQTLTKAPNGMDAVIGEVAPGGVLNYDELVVYSDEACLIKYLVRYS